LKQPNPIVEIFSVLEILEIELSLREIIKYYMATKQTAKPTTVKRETNTYGRIISLTDDGYKAINVPSKSTEHALVFEGTAVFLEYKLNKVKKRHNLTYSNMPILTGSRVLGTFDGVNYDKAALAELFNIEEGNVTDDTHGDIVRLLGSNANVFFINPFSKPPKNDTKSVAYQEWVRGESDKWDTALVLHCVNKTTLPAKKKEEPVADKPLENNSEQKETANNETQTPSGETKDETANQPPVEDVAKQVAADLFHNGVANNGKGIMWAKSALNQKQINHQQYVDECSGIIEEAFLRGMDSYDEILPPAITPAIDFLIRLKERNASALNAMKLAGFSDEATDKENQELSVEIDTIIGSLSQLIEA
jgi:hypothetical protein